MRAQEIAGADWRGGGTVYFIVRFFVVVFNPILVHFDPKPIGYEEIFCPLLHQTFLWRVQQ